MEPTLAWIGGQEWIFIGLVVALLFGAKRLPDLGRNLGSGMREFKKSITGDSEDDKRPELADEREKSSAKASAPEKEKSESHTN